MRMRLGFEKKAFLLVALMMIGAAALPNMACWCPAGGHCCHSQQQACAHERETEAACCGEKGETSCCVDENLPEDGDCCVAEAPATSGPSHQKGCSCNLFPTDHQPWAPLSGGPQLFQPNDGAQAAELLLAADSLFSLPGIRSFDGPPGLFPSHRLMGCVWRC